MLFSSNQYRPVAGEPQLPSRGIFSEWHGDRNGSYTPTRLETSLAHTCFFAGSDRTYLYFNECICKLWPTKGPTWSIMKSYTPY
jgi:hypothetical protein